MSKAKTPVIDDANKVMLAQALYSLGARVQVVQEFTEGKLSYMRTLAIYRETNNGKSPPKGLLPFSVEVFLRWEHSIHLLLFLQGYERYMRVEGIEEGWAFYYAYCDYMQYDFVQRKEKPLLDPTRAWIGLKLLKSKVIETYQCRKCGGRHIRCGVEGAYRLRCPFHQIPPRIRGSEYKDTCYQ